MRESSFAWVILKIQRVEIALCDRRWPIPTCGDSNFRSKIGPPHVGNAVCVLVPRVELDKTEAFLGISANVG